MSNSISAAAPCHVWWGHPSARGPHDDVAVITDGGAHSVGFVVLIGGKSWTVWDFDLEQGLVEVRYGRAADA